SFIGDGPNFRSAFDRVRRVPQPTRRLAANIEAARCLEGSERAAKCARQHANGRPVGDCRRHCAWAWIWTGALLIAARGGAVAGATGSIVEIAGRRAGARGSWRNRSKADGGKEDRGGGIGDAVREFAQDTERRGSRGDDCR